MNFDPNYGSFNWRQFDKLSPGPASDILSPVRHFVASVNETLVSAHTHLLHGTGGVVSFELDEQDPCYVGRFHLSAVKGTRLFLIVLENLRDLSNNPFNINCHMTRW